MIALDVLAEAIARGVRLGLVDGKVRIHAPEGALSAELRADLVKHKECIAWFLRTLPPFECPSCGNNNPLHWFYTAHGRRCSNCGFTATARTERSVQV